jgi:hypothetical protein
MRKRGTHSPEFKASVGMAAICGSPMIHGSSSDSAERLMQVSQWMNQAIGATPQRLRG